MRAALMTAVGLPLSVETVPDPVASADGAVVQIRATGICRSDWHAWQGHSPLLLPHVGGHECAGVVAEVGLSVSRIAVGDRVTLPFCCGCGRCDFCQAGETQLCRNGFFPGFQGWGSFAEFVTIPHADLNLVVLPDSLDDATAASLGCRFMTAWAAVQVHGQVQPGDWVVVHGCGGLGLAAVIIAAAEGANVIAVDPQAAKREAALALGAAAAVDPTDGDVAAAVRELSGGGAHVSLDAIGAPSAIEASIASLRPRGVHVQVGLLFGADATPAVAMNQVLGTELRIAGAMGMAVRHYAALLRAIDSGWVDPRPLITKTTDLGGISAELTQMTRFGQSGVTVAML